MSNEISFFVYLLEKYAEYKNTDAQLILEALDQTGLTDYVMQMYPMYHTERIENAFSDIDRKAAMRGVQIKSPQG
ncbi:MAG: DUF3791 domain-containing protein [Chitinispirillia bacterium]|nr:DUF3791 domain-containing protein [Chitinispirillia bacterium]